MQRNMSRLTVLSSVLYASMPAICAAFVLTPAATRATNTPPPQHSTLSSKPQEKPTNKSSHKTDLVVNDYQVTVPDNGQTRVTIPRATGQTIVNVSSAYSESGGHTSNSTTIEISSLSNSQDKTNSE